jgi:hypothetical protein
MKKKNLLITSAMVAALAVPLVSSSQAGSTPQGPGALSIDRLIGLEAPEGQIRSPMAAAALNRGPRGTLLSQRHVACNSIAHPMETSHA